MTDTTIAQNIAKLRERIRTAAQNCGRDPASITLLAVSKTRSAAAVRAAADCGIDNGGENYLQEALEKLQALEDLALHWHFIGPLQSNKTREVASHFSWVHSVDRLKIAKRLSDQRPEQLGSLNVCLQVNISDEASKAGLAVANVPDLAREVASLPRLRLRGLMAIPAPPEGDTDPRAPFAALRALQQSLQKEHPELDTLSMGMSGDMEAAIAEGATVVRIGTDVFGPR